MEADSLSPTEAIAAVAFLVGGATLMVYIIGEAIVRHWRRYFGQQRRRGFEVITRGKG